MTTQARKGEEERAPGMEGSGSVVKVKKG